MNINNINSASQSSPAANQNKPVLERNAPALYEALKNDAPTLAKAAFTGTGILAGAIIVLKAAVFIGLLSVSLASLATPVGWAALGVLAVGLTVLAVRHACVDKPETQEHLQGAMGWGAGACVITVLSPLLLMAAAYGGASGGGGGGGGYSHTLGDDKKQPRV